MSRPTWETGWAFFLSGGHPPRLLPSIAGLPSPPGARYSQSRHAMKHLTKEQQKVLCVIILLLLTGLAVKTWRRAHPPTDPAVTAWPVQKP